MYLRVMSYCEGILLKHFLKKSYSYIDLKLKEKTTKMKF